MFHVEQSKKFDILIIGGGHAGVEAAHIAAKFVDSVGLITLPSIGLASAPCNPSIGGVGKGQVVRELDSLGGIMPKLADMAGIQYRTLNESKGYAVHSTRVQIDKDLYSKFAEKEISKIQNIEVIREKVFSVSKVSDVFKIKTTSRSFDASKVVVTVGTFLNGKLHVGRKVTDGGRIHSESVDSIDDIFSNINRISARFKTGTPARIKKDSVDYSKMDEQPSDDSTLNFHYRNFNKGRNVKQVSCYLARTNDETMSIIRDNKEKSPMYNGQIKAIGARYCPSIEDKAYRYPDKNIHHVFVEPEGLDVDTVYPSGISSSLPEDVQDKFIRTIEGLEECDIDTYGYAVEYDVVDTTCLSHSLEYKDFMGLYFAGQVNGTSGYEEAAGQGFIAGLNASLSFLNRESFHLSRTDSYIGVMIEDLISNKRDEPYRLFTARSENRLLIREDNVLQRMYKYKKLLALFDEQDVYQDQYIKSYILLSNLIEKNYLNPSDSILELLTGKNDFPNRISIKELLKQSWLKPDLTLERYLELIGLSFDKQVVKTVAIEAKYSGYIDKSISALEKINRLDSKKLDLDKILSSENISYECKQRINEILPVTFGQLKRMDGLRQATLAVVAATL